MHDVGQDVTVWRPVGGGAVVHDDQPTVVEQADALGMVATLATDFVALRGVRETPTSTAELDWRRHLELCLAGLRP